VSIIPSIHTHTRTRTHTHTQIRTCTRSVPFSPLEETLVAYAKEPLMTDPEFRSRLIEQLSEVAR